MTVPASPVRRCAGIDLDGRDAEPAVVDRAAADRHAPVAVADGGEDHVVVPGQQRPRGLAGAGAVAVAGEPRVVRGRGRGAPATSGRALACTRSSRAAITSAPYVDRPAALAELGVEQPARLAGHLQPQRQPALGVPRRAPAPARRPAACQARAAAAPSWPRPVKPAVGAQQPAADAGRSRRRASRRAAIASSASSSAVDGGAGLAMTIVASGTSTSPCRVSITASTASRSNQVTDDVAVLQPAAARCGRATRRTRHPTTQQDVAQARSAY